MLKALVFKELRETWWIAGLAAAVLFYSIFQMMGTDLLQLSELESQKVPFVFDNFFFIFMFIAGSFAIALGFWQTVVESFRRTWPFLLHRPVARGRLIGIKLGTGLLLYLVTMGVLILFYALWAATPGTHAGPFEWSMTAEIWLMWVTISLLYLGAFWSGLRDARWYVSRLLPLIGTVIFSFLIVVMNFDLQGTWWWMIAAVICMGSLLIAAILHEAREQNYS